MVPNQAQLVLSSFGFLPLVHALFISQYLFRNWIMTRLHKTFQSIARFSRWWINEWDWMTAVYRLRCVTLCLCIMECYNFVLLKGHSCGFCTRYTGIRARFAHTPFSVLRMRSFGCFLAAMMPLSRGKCAQFMRKEFHWSRLWFNHWDWKSFTHSPVRAWV